MAPAEDVKFVSQLSVRYSTLFKWHLMSKEVRDLQETNDKYLGNIQRGGTSSLVPRISVGEITPEKLVSIGLIAKKHNV